jgi:Amt family ammonium transporter
MAMNWRFDGKPNATGAVTGAVAGLATVTPASGFVPPWAAMVIGLMAGCGCFLAMKWRAKRGWDDALDVWACHGIGGTIGVLATGLFAVAAVNGVRGVVDGNPSLFLAQAGAALLVAAYSFAVTFVLLKAMVRVAPVEVPEADERAGLDRALHGEAAYTP